ncbi:hypothetical protein NLU13_8825 [Sarocladium strictum]|uniref:Delta(24)-sterol reductase n=1 Tax=Sarocladium strictum TaxID=5046 RepID=A0AA39L3U3_SARSR|nr:hypothetical protein NLU13_8825 [Sarocladium strictum]
MDRHKQAVTKIASAVKGFFERGEPFRITHGSTNSTRPRPSQRLVDISSLSNVLSVDRVTRTALVEPNVPMDRLVEHTLKHGLVPPVVMEFPGITAGGGYAGTAGESSSFKHGFFDETVNEVEMVLGNGDVVRANRSNQYADLFRGAAGAVGSLGVTTLLELNLLEAKKYVQTTYHRAGSVAEAIAKVREETANPENDYVDGILFSKNHGVVVTGKLTDEKPSEATARTFSGAWDPWFYMHVQDSTRSPADRRVTEYLPLAEYLFRYDRGGFWVAACAFTYFWFVPFTRFFRWFLDDFLHTRMMYRALHASGQSARFVVQDLNLPYENAEKFVDYTADEFGIWPLWLCPLKQTPPPTFHPHTGEIITSKDPATGKATQIPAEKESLNIGLWGWGPADYAAFLRKNVSLEAKLQELNGMKWLYAHTYYSQPQFWDVYGGSATRKWYDALRAKYHAATLPTVYDKVKIDVEARQKELAERKGSFKNMWPVAGVYGIYKAIKSRDYRLHRDAKWKYKGE